MGTRATLLTLILLCPAGGVVCSIWFGLELRRFLTKIPVIGNRNHLDKFRRVAVHQACIDLLQFVLLCLPLAIWVIGRAIESLTKADLLFVIIPSVILLALTIVCKKLEKDVQHTPASDQVLLAERDRIIETWGKTFLPSW